MILVFGKTGQVARELAALPDVICLHRAAADLSDPATCAAAVNAHAPDAVINAAAYIAVDQAEQDEALARVINGDAPGAIALTCAERDIPFVQISTDYVFDGSGSDPWSPDANTSPLGAYGRTKLIGEERTRAAVGAHAILRTSWVVSPHGKNFVKTMLRLGTERSELSVVSDQIGGPTSARDIARACHAIAEQLIESPQKTGTYHFSGTPDCSWADFARAIFERGGIDCTVRDIPTTDYPTPAKRPLNSRLNCDTTKAVFGTSRPDWRDSLKDILSELGALA
jgi:dTDP-4-dehydrorhamnose reductase